MGDHGGSNAAFALGLLAGVPCRDNVVTSPTCVQAVLGVLSLGLQGEALAQLRPWLAGQAADVPTAVMLGPDVKLHPEFEAQAANANTEVLRAADPRQLCEKANSWAADQTQGKIQDLVDPAVLQYEDLKLILLSAVYFKKSWKVPFERGSTHDGTFLNRGQSPVTVPFMQRTGSYPHSRLAELNGTLLELPYEDQDTSMVIVLPDDPMGLPNLEKGLTSEVLIGALKKLRESRVELSLPRFKVHFSGDLCESLRSLGITEALSPTADLSRLAEGPLYVSGVVHGAEVAVDEQGTEAAAATAVRIAARCLPPEFRAEHPFLFFILRRRSVVLFAGRVADL